jgi:hypothetical protein
MLLFVYVKDVGIHLVNSDKHGINGMLPHEYS